MNVESRINAGFSQNVQKNTIIVQNPLVKIVQKCYYTFVKKIDRGACPHITNKEGL